jgi:hypothetical protein
MDIRRASLALGFAPLADGCFPSLKSSVSRGAGLSFAIAARQDRPGEGFAEKPSQMCLWRFCSKRLMLSTLISRTLH